MTAAPVANLPGLPALAYRVGTHAAFKATMKANLSRQPALSRLTTRDDDDPSIALLDVWATVLDVLTFYQERIANEGYLRTATETGSVRELARAIGYELSPGVAAGTLLAFELETAAGAPGELAMPEGVKVQSLPGPGQLPQVFETVEELEAKAAWNSLRARTAAAGAPAEGARELHLAGVVADLQPGDRLLFLGRERRTEPSSDRWEVRTIESVRPDPPQDVTRVTLSAPLGPRLAGKTLAPGGDDPSVLAFRRRAALFGHNAPDWRAMPDPVRRAYQPTGVLGAEWPTMSLSRVGTTGSTSNPAGAVFLDAVYPQIVAGGWALLTAAGQSQLSFVQAAAADSRTDFTVSAKATRLDLTGPALTFFENRLRQVTVLAESEPLRLAAPPHPDPVQGHEVELESPVPRLPEGRRVVVTGRRAHVAVSRGASPVFRPAGGGSGQPLRPGEILAVQAPFAEVAGGRRSWTLRRGDGRLGSVVAARPDLLATAAPEGETLAEEATTGPPSGTAEMTTLRLNADLVHCFDRATLRIAANVARATHGETRAEVLGSGDNARGFQRFALKQSPLTYLRDGASPTGAADSLEVRVDGVLWTEARSLFDAGPRTHAHIVRTGDDGRAVVAFGDGTHGARLPTGQENVTAIYRVGTGLAGMVEAGQLSLLMTRLLGLRSAYNPFAAEGAEDPESGDRARQNAPHTVRTLDRVVSLLDFESFAATFAGVGKALATWLWDGETRLVHLTVAAADGQPLAPASATSQALVAAIRAAGDPRQALRVDPYEPRPFRVEAGVVVDPAHQAGVVLAEAVEALRDTFAFDRRAFGQSVAASEVMVTIQRVRGVTAVDLLRLHTSDQPPAAAAVLPALRAHREGGAVRAAQLLTLDLDGIRLSELR